MLIKSLAEMSKYFPSPILEYNGQLFQDAFVDQLLDIDEGFFVDIGAGTGGVRNQPIRFFSNTHYFEKNRDWNGIAIDYDSAYIDFAKDSRKCSCVCADLLDVNINEVLEKNNCPTIVDYLSFDVDDAQEQVFDELDFERYKFKVVTFEHDLFINDGRVLNLHRLSRQKFLSMGYELLLGDISLEGYGPMEDWYINPDFVKDKNIQNLKLDLWRGGVRDFAPSRLFGKVVIK